MEKLTAVDKMIEILKERVDELRTEDQQSPYVDICIKHVEDELAKLIKFLTP